METCIASYNRRQKDELFRIYITDGLFALVNRTASYDRRWIDLVEEMEHRADKTEKKEKTAADVKAQIKAKIRGGNAT